MVIPRPICPLNGFTDRCFMEFNPGHITYVSRQQGSSILVWIGQINRYIILEEPAFWVFQQIAGNTETHEIISGCSERYRLRKQEAEAFTEGIRTRLESLYIEYQEPEDRKEPLSGLSVPTGYASQHQFEMAGREMMISFGDQHLSALIYPIFSHLEVPSTDGEVDLNLEIFRQEDRLYMIINRQEALSWSLAEVNLLRGVLYMKVLEMIHHTLAGEWMGVIHASTIFKGDQALMFPGGPGDGKSTIAALLMAHGCGLVADDFTPVGGKGSRVYPFPGRISVKEGALAVLQPYFPELKQTGKRDPHTGKGGAWLTPRNTEIPINKGYAVRAILFVKYQKSWDCELKPIEPMEEINHFLRESWLENRPRTAEQFMEWFFRTPCYVLHYGDSEKAVKSVLTLLNHVP